MRFSILVASDVSSFSRAKPVESRLVSSNQVVPITLIALMMTCLMLFEDDAAGGLRTEPRDLSRIARLLVAAKQPGALQSSFHHTLCVPCKADLEANSQA
jgi:hypothetical protein